MKSWLESLCYYPLFRARKSADVYSSKDFYTPKKEFLAPLLNNKMFFFTMNVNKPI